MFDFVLYTCIWLRNFARLIIDIQREWNGFKNGISFQRVIILGHLHYDLRSYVIQTYILYLYSCISITIIYSITFFLATRCLVPRPNKSHRIITDVQLFHVS